LAPEEQHPVFPRRLRKILEQERPVLHQALGVLKKKNCVIYGGQS
jgi:hypothetical protein